MSLNCFCDHCQNNTCTTQNGVCFAEWALSKSNEIVKTLNCLQTSNQNSELYLKLACESSNTKLIKCCSTDFCNDENLLPPYQEAKEKFASQINQLRSHSLSSQTSSSSYYNQLSTQNDSILIQSDDSSLFDRYSNYPLEIKIIFIILLGFLLVFSIALAQTCSARSRKRTRATTNAGARTQVTINGRPSRNDENQADQDHSESSSNILASDAAVYDTNSMASREPLISHGMYTTNSLTHPRHKGPWMIDDACRLAHATFQMSVGAGAAKIDKPDTSSGSGSGQPYLTQRSIAHDIELKDVVGRGYYGVVWRGDYKGEMVAVKIFSAFAEPSWQREAEIYQTTLLRHKNILGFIATDKRDDIAMTGYWLVTDYYPLGSLYEFLKKNSISMQDSIRMAFSIANGLSHLHVEIFGTQGKPAIAHRDIKSKNILVKNDGTCCIADLGMAVRYSSNSGVVDVPSNTRVGTRRYLAPELMEKNFNLMDFEAVKATDVYAFGLVLWEILRRTCFRQPGENDGMVIREEPEIRPESEAKGQLSPQTSAQPVPSTSKQTPQKSAPTPSTLPVSPPQAPPQQPASQQQKTPKPTTSVKSTNQAQQTPQSGIEDSFQTGTPRYPPETPIVESFEVSMEETNNDLIYTCDPCSPPYHEYVSADPTTEEMRQIVCVNKIRPTISYRWTRFAPMRDFCTVMRECWYEKPQARLSALRIRKTLGDIGKQYYDLSMEYD